MKDQAPRTIIRFGIFEADLQTGELRKAGLRVQLQAQPFRVLTLLLERPGEIVTREEMVRELWGSDTFVDFDQSIGAIIRKLRRALGDSAAAPRYIETLRQRGYRFLLPAQRNDGLLGPLPVSVEEGSERRKVSGFWRSTGLAATAAVSIILLSWAGHPFESTGYNRGVKLQRAPAHTRNKDAYIAYQKGRYLWSVRTAAAVENSIDYFQKAVNLDPDYAPAYSGLADAYAILNFYTGRQDSVWVERARAASERALKLDNSMAEPHATQAYIRFYYDWDWPGAENGFKQAIALNPDYATAHQWYAEYLMYMGRFQEALHEINRAHELDPQSVVISLQLASPFFFSGQFDQAITKIREAMRLNPEFPLGIYMLATCYEQLGRFSDALAEYRKISGTMLGLTGLGYASGKSGRQQQARQILQQLLSDSRRDELSPYHVARVYAGLGDTSQAFAWLKKARDARDERMVMVRVDPKLGTLRSDPLFADLLRSLGLGEEVYALSARQD